MAWYFDLGKTIRNWRAKTAPLGGFELLRRLSGGDWNITSSLEQYGKSLYVFACISKIAEKTASIDLEMYKVLNSKGDTKEIATHPALDLLYRVNPFQTRTEFWETTVINLKCTGDAFWLKVRNKGGKVVELWNMRPDMITIVSDPVLFVKAYELHKADGSQISIAPEDVVHFKYPDPLSQHLGMSPIRPAHRRVQTEDYATAFQRDFFLNSARPDAVIKNPNQSLTDTQKKDIREGWNKRFRGVGNTSKVAILEGGLEYQLISITQKEMDYIESMKFTRDDILVAFKVPKPIVAVVDDVNRANSETAMAIFLGETIRPEIARIVEKINEELIIPDFGAEFYIDFVDPTPTNRTAEIEEHASALQNNWKLINEVRQEEGLPPVKGGWTMYMPVMSVPVGGLPQGDNAGKGIVKFVKAGGATKSSAYEVQPIEKKRTFSFKGRMFLLYHFQIREAISEAMQKALAAKSKRGKKKGAKKTKKWVSFLADPEMKAAHATIINKRLDERAKKLKDAVEEFAAEQHARVLKSFNANAEEKSVTVEIATIFDKKKETSLAIEFIAPYLASMLQQAGQEAMEQVAPAEDFTDSKHIQTLIKARAKDFAKSTSDTTLDKIASTLADGIASGEGIADLQSRIKDVYEEFPTYRSELIARTEATTANNLGQLEAYRQSGVANGKEWINAGDSIVREEHEDGIGVGGEIVALDEDFSNGLGYPQEPNCRCVLGPAFLE